MCQFKWINLSGSGEKEKASVIAVVIEQIVDDNFCASRNSRASTDKKIWRDCEKLFSTAVFEGRLKPDKLGYHQHSKLSKSIHQFKTLSNSIYTEFFLKSISTCKKYVSVQATNKHAHVT